MKDLVLLVADKNAQFALQGALERPQAFAIRPITFEFRVHVGRDGGARRTGPEMLALERQRFSHGLLIVDFEGSGANVPAALDLETELDGRLQPHWEGRAKSIVIEPELDAWMWGSDNALEQVINWTQAKGLREWLRERGFHFLSNQKPCRPKEAIEEILYECQTPRSSALYRRIAERISLRRCTDPAFQRLRQQLVRWFGLSTHPSCHPGAWPIGSN